MSSGARAGRSSQLILKRCIVSIVVMLFFANNLISFHTSPYVKQQAVHRLELDDAPNQEQEVNQISKLFAAATAIDHGPFLVVCDTVDNSLRPAFDNFTVVRLNKDETPPSWNSTVFLHGEDCTDHPYVQQALTRRNQSPFLDAACNVSSALLNQTSGIWAHGVHWPNYSSPDAAKYLRVIRDRPAIINVYGEVFWRMHYYGKSCRDVDFVVYREVETLLPDCLTIHFLQGVSTSIERGKDGEFGTINTTKILDKTMPHPHKSDRVDSYNKFCSFIAKYNSTHPVHMFNTSFYDVDALVRHMLFLQLSQYKPCERVTNCPGGPYTAFKCMVGYKFHITMDNTLVDGYVSEKLFNGALAGGVPLYFGASDVGKYVNEKSFIHCNVSRKVIEKMRLFYPRSPRPRRFLFNFSSTWPTEEEMLLWADGYLRPQLEPCVKRVIELDTNDNDYMAVLNEPFLLDRGVMSGISYPLQGIALAYNILRGQAEL